MRAAIITISTSLSEGRGEDESGPALADWARGIGAEVTATEVVADERPRSSGRCATTPTAPGCDLVLTTGGTGMAPSDVTPEATRAVIEREAPGIAEAMRARRAAHPELDALAGGGRIRGRP